MWVLDTGDTNSERAVMHELVFRVCFGAREVFIYPVLARLPQRVCHDRVIGKNTFAAPLFLQTLATFAEVDAVCLLE